MNEKIKFTPEQLTELQSFFQQNDFTANMTLDREYDLTVNNLRFLSAPKRFSGNIGSKIYARSV